MPGEWKDFLPPEETTAAIRKVAAVWEMIRSERPSECVFKKRETKLTELLSRYLQHMSEDLDGFFVFEGQRFPSIDKPQFYKNEICYQTNRATRFRIEFEFKKVSTAKTITVYLGSEGLRRFVDGKYALGDRIAIMIGICQPGTCVDTRQSVQSRLDEPANKTKLGITGSPSTIRPSQIDASSLDFDTNHRRNSGNDVADSIEVGHVFIECAQ